MNRTIPTGLFVQIPPATGPEETAPAQTADSARTATMFVSVYEFTPLEEVTEEKFYKHFDVNVLSLLLVTQEALKHFDPVGGSIINISSGVSSVTPPSFSAYTGTKGAVDAITRTLAKGIGAARHPGQRHQPWLGHNRRRHYLRVRSERFPQNSGIADAARTDRSDGRYRAGGGVLRFIRSGGLR